MDMKATKDGKLSSSHHLTPLVEILKKKKKILVMITQFLKKCTTTVIGTVIRMPFAGQNYPDLRQESH